jgi:hypothetical protein
LYVEYILQFYSWEDIIVNWFIESFGF